MKNHFKVLVCLAASVLACTSARALDITLNKNGFADLAGGQLTKSSGPGPAITAQPLGTTTSAVTFTNLAANTTYSLDFFHNSGASGSDFTFKVNAAGTGIESVNLGGGAHTMVTGFTPNDTTLTLNTHTITLNGDGKQDGNYYVYGLFPPGSGVNSAPIVKTVIPGWFSWDNLYNSGLGNEDLTFTVGSNGSVYSFPGKEQYSIFDGTTVNLLSVKVHYKIEASSPINWNVDYNMFNSTNYTVAGLLPRVYEFDMYQTVGNAGINIWSFGSNTVASGNITRSTNANIFVAGPSTVGDTGINDLLFRPRLRYTWTNAPSASTGFTDIYWENTDTAYTVATEYVTGFFDGNTTPLNVLITATIIPEPTSIALVAAAGAFLVIRRRRNA